MDDITLIHAARQGDLEAFNQLVLEYQDLVFQRAVWILGEKQAADDAAQETFIKAFQNLSHFRSGSFRAWILRIVTNTCYDELRRRKRSRQVSLSYNDPDGDEADLLDFLVDPALSPEKTIEQVELQADLLAQVNALPEEFRQTLLLVDMLELTYEEAASVLGVPLGTVKSRLARARLRLRDQITASPDLVSNNRLPASIGMAGW